MEEHFDRHRTVKYTTACKGSETIKSQWSTNGRRSWKRDNYNCQ